MSQRGTIKRYTAIIEKVGGQQYPSAQAILEFLEDLGFSISKRTFERDLDAIRNEFGVEITYDSVKRGYFIDESNSVELSSFLRFLEIVNTADLLTESLSESKQTLNYIHFDQGGGMRGVEQLRPLLQAIKEQREIKFKHFSYQREKWHVFTMQPYLLKEYQNRWYVVGWVRGVKQFRTFGVDRIKHLEVLSATFERDEKVDLHSKFDATIGVIYGDGKRERIVLWFNNEQKHYVKSLPWHPTQEIIEDNDNGLVISLFVVPNYELIQQILMHHAFVKVIAPNWLMEEVKEKLKKGLEGYGRK
jgi:predicted DNA-binding transcriptional regulator YafY